MACAPLIRLKRAGQMLAETPVPFQVPFPAHGLPAGRIALGIKNEPFVAAGRARAGACIMLIQTPLQVGGPTDISPVPVAIFTPQYVDEAIHRVGVTGYRLQRGRADNLAHFPRTWNRRQPAPPPDRINGSGHGDMRQFAPCGAFERSVNSTNHAHRNLPWRPAMRSDDIKRKPTAILAAR